MPKGTVGAFPEGGGPAGVLSQDRPARRSKWKSLTNFLNVLLSAIAGREAWLINTLAFLLSRVSLMGELEPFGLAFFAAVMQVSRRQAPGVAFGALLGVLSTGRYMEAGLYLFSILVCFRLAGRLERLEHRLPATPLILSAAVILGGIPLALWQDAGLYQLMLTLFDAFLCLISAYIFMAGIRLLMMRSQQVATNEMLVCLAIVLATAIAGLGQATVEGYSLRNIAGGFTVMALAMAGGTGLGTAMGVVMGLAAGLSDDNATLLISLYAIGGLLGGSFRMLGKLAVVLGFMLGSLITVLQFGQPGQLAGTLAEAAVAAVIFLVLPLGWFRRWSIRFREEKSGQVPVQTDIDGTLGKLTSVAEIFGSLAAASATAACEAGNKIRELETARMLSAIGGQICGPCPKRKGCWEYDFDRVHQAVLESAAMAEQNDLTVEGLPKLLKDCCLYKNELVKTLNSVAHYNRTCSFWQKKFTSTRQTLTEQLQALSGIIASLAGSLAHQPQSIENLAEALKEEAALAGCPLREVTVNWQARTITVEASKQPCEEQRQCADVILPLAARLLGRKLTMNTECVDPGPGRICRLRLEIADRFKIETGEAWAAKEAQEICGDTFAVFPVEGGKTALIISDGMGSGSRAAGESAATVEYLEKLLKAGFEAEVAVKTVNDMLLLREPEESFATLDIALIDSYAGEAEFVKVGSAPTYIKRVHEVATIKSAALPVGILQQIEIEPVKWLLAPGDIIVMVSDGVIDAAGRTTSREPWLVNFLRRSTDTEPQELADKILRQAMSLAAGRVCDDMTVLVAQVGQRQVPE